MEDRVGCWSWNVVLIIALMLIAFVFNGCVWLMMIMFAFSLIVGSGLWFYIWLWFCAYLIVVIGSWLLCVKLMFCSAR